ncbi:MAG: TolC family protein [Chloroherpetonaceae bacterium]|nr:TolC family protein [Chthonomonadaceae bacterium]MDW8208903.1 TolC family protein [Chloroherpetonaceae bacterium]
MSLFWALWVTGLVRSVLAHSPVVTVEQAIHLAVQQHPRLQAARLRMDAAQTGVRAARALPLPTFFFAPGVPNVNGTTEELLFTQPLELNGTRAARLGVARAQMERARAEALAELQQVVFEVKRAYFELFRAQQQLTLARDLLADTERLHQLTGRLVELGARPGIERVQTDIERVRARQQVAVAEGEMKAALAGLNGWIGRRPDAPAGTLSLALPSPEALSLERLREQAYAHRAEIRGVQAAREQFFQEARLARAEGLPDIAPQFRAQNLIRSFTPQDYGFSLVVTLPLFDWGGRRQRARQAEQAARAEEALLLATQVRVQQEVAQALARYQAAGAVLQEFPEGLLAQSRRLWEGALRAFQTGAPGASLITVLEAQRTYRAVQREYIHARVDLAIAHAALERATGQVPAFLQEAVLATGGREK